VLQVPATSATAPAAAVVAEAGPAGVQPIATEPAPAPSVTGRRLLGRVQTDRNSPTQQQLAAVEQLHPYSSSDEVADITEHVSGTQLYYAVFKRGRTSLRGRGQQHSHTSPNRSGRQLLVLQDELDNFRRGPLREQCAREAASDWRPYKLFNLTEDVAANPRYGGLLQSGDVVSVISEATANLNAIRDATPVQTPVQAQPAAAAVPAAAAAAAVPSAASTPAATAAVPEVQAQPAAQQLG
jgi:hypothetical protein